MSLLAKRNATKPPSFWKCKKCGDDKCWSALLAGTEKFFSESLLAVADESLSSADYCSVCFWFKVTGREPTPDELTILIDRVGYGIEDVMPGHYGPKDDTSPGYDNCVRAREGDRDERSNVE